MIIDLTLSEARVAVELINVAVQAQGLRVAESGLVLARKFQLAIQTAGDEAVEQPTSLGSEDDGEPGT